MSDRMSQRRRNCWRRFGASISIQRYPVRLHCRRSRPLPARRVLYGSDYPYAPVTVSASFTQKLDAYQGFSEAEHASVNRGNALRLFSSLKGLKQTSSYSSAA